MFGNAVARGEWFELDGKRYQFLGRFPTTDEKLAHLAAEHAARGGGSAKPGDAAAFDVAAWYRATMGAVVPLVTGYVESDAESVNEHTLTEDERKALAEDGRFVEPLFSFGQYLFRPASVVGNAGA
jgi:hypothetical protein